MEQQQQEEELQQAAARLLPVNGQLEQESNVMLLRARAGRKSGAGWARGKGRRRVANCKQGLLFASFKRFRRIKFLICTALLLLLLSFLFLSSIQRAGARKLISPDTFTPTSSPSKAPNEATNKNENDDDDNNYIQTTNEQEAAEDLGRPGAVGWKRRVIKAAGGRLRMQEKGPPEAKLADHNHHDNHSANQSNSDFRGSPAATRGIHERSDEDAGGAGRPAEAANKCNSTSGGSGQLLPAAAAGEDSEARGAGGSFRPLACSGARCCSKKSIRQLASDEGEEHLLRRKRQTSIAEGNSSASSLPLFGRRKTAAAAAVAAEETDDSGEGRDLGERHDSLDRNKVDQRPPTEAADTSGLGGGNPARGARLPAQHQVGRAPGGSRPAGAGPSAQLEPDDDWRHRLTRAAAASLQHWNMIGPDEDDLFLVARSGEHLDPEADEEAADEEEAFEYLEGERFEPEGGQMDLERARNQRAAGRALVDEAAGSAVVVGELEQLDQNNSRPAGKPDYGSPSGNFNHYRGRVRRARDRHQRHLNHHQEDEESEFLRSGEPKNDDPARKSRRPASPPNELQAAAEVDLSRIRNSQRRSLSGSDNLQVQTIYFGGFFPWLDEDSAQVGPTKDTFSTRGPTGSGASREHANGDPGGESPKQQKQARKRKQQQHKLDNATISNPSGSATSANSPVGAAAPASSSSASYTSPENRHQLGRFILPAVRLALEHINTNLSVLGSYRLEIVPRDTQCNATISLKEFFDMVYEEPKKMLLYGDACRVSTDPIAKASYFFDLIQISYADTDPIYTIENYPNFFRVVPSENALSLARIPFIRHFNWTRVGTIYQNLPRYSLPHSKLLTDLERFNIVIKQSVSLPGSVDGLQNRDLGDELRKLKEKDVRIILGNFDEEWALLLFCEAFRERMTGRKYQWILTGVSEDGLWQYYKRKGATCSEQELLVAMDGYITTDITTVTRSQQPTISGLMAHEYSNAYQTRAREMNISIEENKFYGYVYDGIWAIALALHRVDYQLKYYNRLAAAGRGKLNPEVEGLSSLLDFDYHKPIWVKLIRNALNKTRFSGVTGTVSFHKNERPGLISFSQFQAFRNKNEVLIGSYDALNDNLDLNVGFPIFWRGSSPPIDYTIQRVTPFRISRKFYAFISIVAAVGIVLAFIFLIINIKFRNQRYIKMSSPYLNNLIIIGCILTYSSVIILGLDSSLTSEFYFPYICNARAWVLMAGFTLAFGSMFSKTFRVHSIFTNIKLHKKVIKDYKLFMVVFILLTFDFCILIMWQYMDPFYRETNNGTSIQDLDNEDIIIVPEMEHCQSKRMTIFLSVIYVYKGLLMAFGCFLAWETRHVSIPALNDSKYIGLSVYNVVIMCVIGASLSFVLRDQQDASFVIISIFIIFCSTATLCLVFVPKLYQLKQNPRPGDHRVRATLKTFKKNYHEDAFGAAAAAAAGCRDIHGNLIHPRAYGVDLNERIKMLVTENIKQRAVLKEKTYELEALTYRYRKIQGMIQSGQCLQAIKATASGESLTTPTDLNRLSPVTGSSSLLPVPSSAQHSAGAGGGGSAGAGSLRKPPIFGSGKLGQEKVSFGNLKVDKLASGSELNKSAPLALSITQITSTTTSTNQTDITSDLTTNSNSRTTATSSSSGAGQCQQVSQQEQLARRPVVAFGGECLHKPPGSRKPAPAQLPAGNYPQNLVGCATGKVCTLCPGGELAAGLDQTADLFTVFSYAHSAKNLPGGALAADRKSRLSRSELAESNFNRWSEGPFCTLMVKNIPQHAGRRAQFEEERLLSKADRLTGSCKSEVGASCPSIAGKSQFLQDEASGAKRTPPERRIVHQSSSPVRQVGKIAAGKRIPRTLSMIEYLGMSQFDIIARRHDKLMKRRQVLPETGSAPPPPPADCCYEISPTCVYCRQEQLSKQPRPMMGKFQWQSQQQIHSRAAQTKATSGGQSQLAVCSSANRSENDVAFSNASSNEPLNSANDFIQTSSGLSCSSCCSLASSASQSELFGAIPGDSAGAAEPTSASISSSQTLSSASSLNNPHPHHHHHHHHHHPHFSQHSQSSSSSSINQHHHYCQHHHQRDGTDNHLHSSASSNSCTLHCHHHHHQQQQDHRQTGCEREKRAQEEPLCISGSHFGGKEDANNAANNEAQSISGLQSSTLTSGISIDQNKEPDNCCDDKLMAELDTSDNQRNNNKNKKTNFAIKCDILENL